MFICSLGAYGGPEAHYSVFTDQMVVKKKYLTEAELAELIALTAILPGLLLIYFIYPVWENLKKIKGIKMSLKGITAVAGGLITVSAIILMQENTLTLDNILITLFTVIILLTKKVPAPFIVIATLIIGFIV